LSYTDYQHQEIDANVIDTTFSNKSTQSRLEIQHQLQLIKGLIGFQSSNSDFAALGRRLLVQRTRSHTEHGSAGYHE